MLWLNLDLRTVFWVATIPACLAVFVLWVGVREPHQKIERNNELYRNLPWHGGGALPPLFWAVVAVGTALTMSRFSEAFLILRAQEAGLGLAYLPLALVVMNVVYAATAYPAGAMSDRTSPFWLLAAGCAVLLGADAALAYGDDLAWSLGGVALWGLHMGLTQGVLAALVAAAAPEALRATAFGLFNLVTGLVAVAASSLAGLLWQAFGSQATFAAGGVFAMLALFGIAALASMLKIR